MTIMIENYRVLSHAQPQSLMPPPPYYYCKKEVNVIGDSRSNKQLIKWIPPPNGFVKMNTDATIKSNGKNGYGIVVRDQRGFWRLGCCGCYKGNQFDKKIGPKSNVVVEGELRAIMIALLIAIKKDFSSVIIESDSLTAINMIKFADHKGKDSTNDNIALECRKLISQISICILEHTKREGNFCADKMADLGSQSSETVQIFENVPKQVIPYIMADYWGFYIQRGVKLTEEDIAQVCEQVSRRWKV